MKSFYEKKRWQKFLMKTFHEMIYEYILSCQTYFFTYFFTISKLVSQNSINGLIFQNPIYYLILRSQRY